MPKVTEDEARARSVGRALLDASSVYEDFLIPRWEGVLRLRRVPQHRRLTTALVARQRRFLRAAYTLADAGQMLEALGPVRSMFEFLVRQRWLALDSERNWKLWIEHDHAARDRWRMGLRKRAPALHDAAVASLTPEQHQEAQEIAAVRARVRADLDEPRPNDRSRVDKQMAERVGLGFIYDAVYQYESSVAVHPTLLAIDVLSQRRRRGLLVCREPTTQFAPVAPYLQGALLLHAALKGAGEQTQALSLPQLPSLGRDLRTLAEERLNARLPNWRQLLGTEVDELL